jgi:general secretion pathway protein K
MSRPSEDIGTQHRDPRSGIVLIAVLWTIALLSALAIATSMTFHGFTGILGVDRDKAQADGLLSAALEFSAGVVTAFGERPLTTFEKDVTLPTGSLHLRITDEGGRIDVNKAPIAVLTSLLRSVGASDPDQIAKSIDTWRREDKTDTDKAPQNQAPSPAPAPPSLVNTAPQAFGQPQGVQTTSQPPPQATQTNGQGVIAAPPTPADSLQSFSDIRQLAQIPGMTQDTIAALAPLTTVFGDDRVNALSASAQVLAALPDMVPERVETFLAVRQGPINEAQLQQLLGPVSGYVKLQGRPVALAEMSVQLPDGYRTAAKAVIVVIPGDSQPYRVLAWTPVPAGKSREANAGDLRRDDAD